MSDYRNASFDELHAAEKRAQREPMHHVKIGLAVVGLRLGMWAGTVPDEYVGEDTETQEVVVSCVCGTEVRIGGTAVPVRCEGCARWFLFDGRRVCVTRPSDSSSA